MNKIHQVLFLLGLTMSTQSQTLSDGEYFIKINQTGKYVAVAGATLNNGAWVVQWDNEYKAHFKFNLKHLGNNTYSIQATHSGKFLSTEGRAVRGAKIVQWDWLNQDNQKWRIERSMTGYTITCVENEQRMFLSGLNAATSSPTNGAYFICNSDDNAMNFTFRKNETVRQLIPTKPGTRFKVLSDGSGIANWRSTDLFPSDGASSPFLHPETILIEHLFHSSSTQ